MSDYATRRTVMVDTQVRPSDVTKFPIIEAMLTVPRAAFLPDDKRDAAYVSENIDLGGGRVVLEPRTLAKLLDSLDIQPDEMVLDLGCGLGYSTAVIASLAEAVVAVEEIENMANEAQALLSANEVDNAAVIAGPLAAGDPRHGPYDVIVIEGAIEVLPQAISDQLKEGGRIGALFMDGHLGVAKIGLKLEGRIVWRFAFNAAAPILNGFRKTQEFVL